MEGGDLGELSPPASPSRALPTLFKLDPTMLSKTEGWVWKKGGISSSGIRRRNWKKRWFQIIEQRTDSYPKYDIEYYDKPGGMLKGTIDLEGAEVFTEERNKFTLQRNRFEWQILLATGTTILLASYIDQQDRDDWVMSINMIVAYLVKMRRASAFTLDGYDPAYEEEEEVFDTGHKLAQNCQAFGPGLFGSEAGQVGKFFIQMHDLQEKQIDVGGMPFTARLEDDEVLYHIKVVDHGDGSYSAHYVLKRPGVYKLSIMLNDLHHVYGSPYEVNVMSTRTHPSQCTAGGPAIESVSLGEDSQFTITAKDLFGNSKPRGGDPFEVGVMGPAQLTELTDNEDGTYLCSLQGRVPADLDDLATHSLLLMVTLHGKHIAGSPFQPKLNVDAIFNQAQDYPENVPVAAVGNTPFDVGLRQSDIVGGASVPVPELTRTIRPPDNLPRHRSSVAWGGKKEKSTLAGIAPISNPNADSTTSVSRLQAARDKALMAKNNAKSQSQPNSVAGSDAGSVKSSKLTKLTARLSMAPSKEN